MTTTVPPDNADTETPGRHPRLAWWLGAVAVIAVVGLLVGFATRASTNHTPKPGTVLYTYSAPGGHSLLRTIDVPSDWVLHFTFTCPARKRGAFNVKVTNGAIGSTPDRRFPTMRQELVPISSDQPSLGGASQHAFGDAGTKTMHVTSDCPWTADIYSTAPAPPITIS